jgi:hypothetical protein
MQGINVFASEAARNAAITSPQEGQFAYTKDTNSLWYYSGSAWVASGATGDIEGVTVSSPLTGGGTSGTVTVGILSGTTSNLGAVQLSDSISSTSTTLAATANAVKTAYDNAIPKSTITTKGDLIVGTGSGTFVRQGVGANGTVLTADSAEADGVKWATPAGGGKVLQVVYASYSTSTATTSTTYSDSGLSATITPSAATSKVLVLTAQTLSMDRSAGGLYSKLKLLRGTTDILTVGNTSFGMEVYATGTTALDIRSTQPVNYLDSPNTTSATTYKTQIACSQQPGGPTVTITAQKDSVVSTMILLEIGA